MSNLSQIKADSNWGDASNTINTNFQNMDVELEKLKNSTTKFKGYFTSESNLKNKLPSPKRGDIAFVGEPYPGNVYDVLTDGSWHNTTKAPETGSVDLQDYVTKDDFEASQKEQDDKLTELENNIILRWDTDVVSTRKQVDVKKRKPGLRISYMKGNTTWITEQYIAEYTDDANFTTIDSYWIDITGFIGEIVQNTLSIIISGKSLSRIGYIEESGNINKFQNSRHSYLLKVLQGEILLYTGEVFGDVKNIIFYDSNFNVIKTENIEKSENAEVTVPINAVYARCNSTDINNCNLIPKDNISLLYVSKVLNELQLKAKDYDSVKKQTENNSYAINMLMDLLNYASVDFKYFETGFIKNDGSKSSYDGLKTSNILPYISGIDYVYSGVNFGEASNYVCFSKDGNVLKYYVLDTDKIENYVINDKNVPEDTCYIAFNFSATETNYQKLLFRLNLTNDVLSIKSKLESLEGNTVINTEDIKTLKEQMSDIINIVDITNLALLIEEGSSLTAAGSAPVSFNWIDRLNDLTDINIINDGRSGFDLLHNIDALFKNEKLKRETTSNINLRDTKPTYISINNTANGSLIGENGVKTINQALTVVKSYGAKMIRGSESNYANQPFEYENTFKAFCGEKNIPLIAMTVLHSKCYPEDIPYKGFFNARHPGYRAQAPYSLHLDLLNKLPIKKNVKMFKVRRNYKNGNPSISDLNYDSINERVKYFTAISPGEEDAKDTGIMDVMDNLEFKVNGGEDIGIRLSEVADMQAGDYVVFNKFALIEFILDKIQITKGTFRIQSDVHPINVYMAYINYDISEINKPTTEFRQIEFTYSGDAISANISSNLYDLQLYDKVRFIVEYSGEFKLKNPSFIGYDGKDKIISEQFINLERKEGEELLHETGFFKETDWVLDGGSEIAELPSQIANYTSFNQNKSHLEMYNEDASAEKKEISLNGAKKIALRIVACVFPPIATTKFNNTEISDSKYIKSDAPYIKNFDFDYGVLKVYINENYCREFLVWPGWQELYLEYDCSYYDFIDIKIVKKSYFDDSFQSYKFPIFVHNISVQKVE